MATPPRREALFLIDGENIDGHLHDTLTHKPRSEEQLRWERVKKSLQDTFQTNVSSIYFIISTSPRNTEPFRRYLRYWGYHVCQVEPRPDGSRDQVIDDAIRDRIRDRLEINEHILIASHDGGYASALRRSLFDQFNRTVGLVCFRDQISGDLARLMPLGLQVFDLAYDLKAFDIELPGRRPQKLEEINTSVEIEIAKYIADKARQNREKSPKIYDRVTERIRSQSEDPLLDFAVDPEDAWFEEMEAEEQRERQELVQEHGLSEKLVNALVGSPWREELVVHGGDMDALIAWLRLREKETGRSWTSLLQQEASRRAQDEEARESWWRDQPAVLESVVQRAFARFSGIPLDQLLEEKRLSHQLITTPERYALDLEAILQDERDAQDNAREKVRAASKILQGAEQTRQKLQEYWREHPRKTEPVLPPEAPSESELATERRVFQKLVGRLTEIRAECDQVSGRTDLSGEQATSLVSRWSRLVDDMTEFRNSVKSEKLRRRIDALAEKDDGSGDGVA